MAGTGSALFVSMSSSWSLTDNKYSICLHLLTHRKAICWTWGKNHVCCCTHTCPQLHTNIDLSHIACKTIGLGSKDNDDSTCLWFWLCQNDSSKITWWTSVSIQNQEKNKHDMSSHGHTSHFKIEKFGLYLFQMWPQKRWAYNEWCCVPLGNSLKSTFNWVWALQFLTPPESCIFLWCFPVHCILI